MRIPGTVQKHVDSIAWQDYRGSDKGMVIYYNTDPVSEIPIREVPEDFPTDVVAEPNYESGTYGLYGCLRPKIRSAFYKSKLRYMFFMTRYAGTNVDLMDQLMVTGYYHIVKTADVQKLHVRYLADYGCMADETCMAFRADEIRFVSVHDAFMITPEVLEAWGYTSRVTRQTRILLDQEATSKLLEYLRSKTDRTGEYKSETKRLSPDTGEEEEEPEEEEDLVAAENEQAVEETGAEGVLEEQVEEAALVSEEPVVESTEAADVEVGPQAEPESEPEAGTEDQALPVEEKEQYVAPSISTEEAPVEEAQAEEQYASVELSGEQDAAEETVHGEEAVAEDGQVKEEAEGGEGFEPEAEFEVASPSVSESAGETGEQGGGEEAAAPQSDSGSAEETPEEPQPGSGIEEEKI